MSYVSFMRLVYIVSYEDFFFESLFYSPTPSGAATLPESIESIKSGKHIIVIVVAVKTNLDTMKPMYNYENQL